MSPNWRAAEDATVHTTCSSQHYCVFETCICWSYLKKKIKALLYKLFSNKGQALTAADVNKWFNSTLLILLLHYLHFSAHLVSIIISQSVKAAACSQHIKSLSAACRLLSHWSSSFIWLQCDVVAWQQRAKQRPREERERRRRSGRELGEQIRVGAGRQGKEKHIILLCTVCRLNLRNSDTRQHKKGQKNLKYVQKKTNKRSFFGEKHTALVAVLEIVQWIQTNKD